MRNARILLLVAALALVAAVAGAAPTVDGLSVTVNGTSLDFAGTVDFGDQAPVLVGVDAVGDSAVDPTTAPLGLDLETISLNRPDARKNYVEFTWKVTEMNVPPPNEIVRFLWQFTVGGAEYWVQAKMSDLTTATATADDPAGTATHLQGSFRLRGNCSLIGVVSTCHHLAWLDGAFDVDADEARVRVPLDSAAAPAITAGASIDPEQGAEVGLQAAVSNASTADQMSQDEVFVIPAATVTLSVRQGATTLLSGPGTFDLGGDAGGSLDISSLAPGTYDAVMTACFDGCTSASTSFTI